MSIWGILFALNHNLRANESIQIKKSFACKWKKVKYYYCAETKIYCCRVFHKKLVSFVCDLRHHLSNTKKRSLRCREFVDHEHQHQPCNIVNLSKKFVLQLISISNEN